MAASIKIILTEDIRTLGRVGSLVDVKPGYARNYLIPQGLAMRANNRNLALYEEKRAELEQKSAERRQKAVEVAQKLDGKVFIIYENASDKGRLYGSVTVSMISAQMRQDGFEVHNDEIGMNTQIKTLGVYEIGIQFHTEARATVKINVARSEKEAEEQMFLFNNPGEAAKRLESELERKIRAKSARDSDYDLEEAETENTTDKNEA